MIAATVGSIAKRELIQLDGKSNVRQAAQLMVEKDVGAILVSDSENPIGIVTERDLLRKVTSVGTDPNSVELRSVMSSPLITIDTESSLGDATALMLERKIRRLVVVDNGKVIGIIMQRDLLQEVLNVFGALAEISTTM